MVGEHDQPFLQCGERVRIAAGARWRAKRASGIAIFAANRSVWRRFPRIHAGLGGVGAAESGRNGKKTAGFGTQNGKSGKKLGEFYSCGSVTGTKSAACAGRGSGS